MRTPVTYYGGKQLMVNDILSMIPDHEVYTEVYLGGGSIFWAKRPSKVETINDLNDFVVNFYEAIQCDFDRLRMMINSSLVSRTQKVRANEIWKNPKSFTSLQRAWAFWYLANFSFASKLDGGLKYSNKQNSSVTRTLKSKKMEFTIHLKHRIENAIIENRDALLVLESRNVIDAFHYIDPPYINADNGHYGGFTDDDLIDLLDWMTTCKGKFLMSNYNDPIIDSYVQRHGWNIKQIVKPLNATRGLYPERQKIEILVSNYDENQLRLF